MDFKAQLLSLLDDKDVKEKLLCFLGANGADIENKTRTSYKEKPYVHPNEDLIHKKSIDELECLLEQKTINADQLEIENQSMKKLLSRIRCLLGVNEDSKQDLTDEISRLQTQVKIKDEELLRQNSKMSQLQERNLDVVKELEFYQNNFSTELKIAEIYSDFSEKTKLSLAGIFKNTSVTGLVACGIQEKNISNLWDYAKSEIVNGSNNDLDKIVELFDLLFSRFVLAYPMFEQQGVKVGDVFDTHLHIKHNASINTSGSISKVLLKGYLNTKTDKVVKASLVVL